MTQGEDMTTALARSLVDGLQGEGVERVWSNLNERNAPDSAKETLLDGIFFYVAPEAVMRKRRARRSGKEAPTGSEQLSLFEVP